MESTRLLSSLEATARAEAEAAVRAAQAQAEAIAADASRRRDFARARAQAEADASFRTSLAEAVRGARHEAAAAALRARQQLLDEVLRRAGSLLEPAIATESYRKGLKKRLAEALEYVGPKEAIVRCAPVLMETLRQLANGRARIETDDRIHDGFEVIAGGLRVDARLSTELQRRWPEISVSLGRIA